MASKLVTDLDQPLTPVPTEAEKLTRCLRKVQAARALVIELTGLWIQQFEEYRRYRDAGRTQQADTSLQELEHLEGASATAETILGFAEAAHKRLITGPLAFLLAVFCTLQGCYGDPQPAQPLTICTAEYWHLQTQQTTNFPITVELDPALPAAAQYATLEAMARWNHWMDAEVFGDVVVSPRTQQCGTVHVSMQPSDKVLARTVWNRCDAVMGITPQALTREDATVTVSHEFGHVLGLPHEHDGSLMSERAGSLEEPSRMARCIVASALTEADGDDSRMEEFQAVLRAQTLPCAVSSIPTGKQKDRSCEAPNDRVSLTHVLG